MTSQVSANVTAGVSNVIYTSMSKDSSSNNNNQANTTLSGREGGPSQNNQLQQTFGPGQQLQPQPSLKPKKGGDKLNKPTSLPPGVEGNSLGSLFIEIGQMEWFTYDNINYLEESGGEFRPIQQLFANIKFWGEGSKGIYLRCENGMRKSEKVTNKFRYDVRCPERTFEKYLDDMGVLVVDFFDTQRNQTVGTSKIMMKLYIKRAKREDDDQPLLELRGSFPITLTGNQNVKIGQFNLSMVSSFPVAHKHIVAPTSNEMMLESNNDGGLNDSFMVNEQRAQQLAQQEKNKKIHDQIFQDDRIPSSLQGKQRENTDYRKTNFDIDERPTRDRSFPKPSGATLPQKQGGFNFAGKENNRNIINIDENDDTFHNQDELQRILARGQKLRDQMDQALDSDIAWETLHGPHIVPKKYVPPFQQDNKKSTNDDIDRIYELEIDAMDPREIEKEALRAAKEKETLDRFQVVGGAESNPGGHISEMKFIKVKIASLRIENEELLHQLIDTTFTIIVDVPLPDIYQKKIAFQQLKLNNYDIVAFNQFDFNSSTLYNFKVDEDTFNKLVTANMKVQLEGLGVTGSLGMIKLLMSKGYKLEITIPLEKHVKLGEELYGGMQAAQAATKAEAGKKDAGKKATTGKGKEQNKKAGVAAPNKDLPSQVSTSKIPSQGTYSHVVGHITLELALQRGDNDVEIAREYQIKLQKLEEQKAKEDQERIAEMQKYQRYTKQQEPTFATLYININQVKNLCLKLDGTLIQAEQQQHTPVKRNEETFNDRQERQDSVNASQSEVPTQIMQIPLRNLFVQYKAFPGLEKLKTNIAWHEREPRFSYRSQFPIIVNPDTIGKLEKFTFILEVWDHQSPSKEEFIGLVKIPLASFCYSMRTNDEQVFSLNFLADQHCIYPMIISDGPLPIYSPRLGQNVGELSLTLALGTAIQINRQIQKEQEAEKKQIELEMKSKIAEAMRKGQTNALNELPLNLNPPEPFFLGPQQPPPQPVVDETPAKNPLLNFLSGEGSGGEGGGNELFKSLGNFFRQSVNVNNSRDVDYRKLTYLNCLRKLFEEARSSGYQEINGKSEIFREMPLNYDGTIKKDDFIYAIMNSPKGFTLTRTEIANISALLMTPSCSLTPKSTESTSIDLEDLHRSYRAYIQYYDSIESRIKDLLEMFMLPVQKKIEDPVQYDEFVKQIEDKAQESKIQITALRDIFDNNGIYIRDALYDQLSSYFDLDRNDQVYITSFCEYLKNPRMANFNFFKVHPIIVVNLVSEYIKNEVLLRAGTMNALEEDLKKELHLRNNPVSEPADTVNFVDQMNPVDGIREDILISERVNAKLFQQTLLKHGATLSQWEVFTLFDYLNTTYSKMYYEPQRYHQVTFPPFYRFVTGVDYEAKLREDARVRELRAQEQRLKEEFEAQQKLLMEQHQQRMAENPLMRASMESAFDLAADLNPNGKKGGRRGKDSEGIYSNKSYDQISEHDENEDVVLGKKKKKGKKKKGAKKQHKRGHKEMTFAGRDSYDEEEEDSEEEEDESEASKKSQKDAPQEDNRPYRKVKHTFDVQVKELKNIPILDKLIKDITSTESAGTQHSRQAHQVKKDQLKNRYIQSVAVKYAFPLDEDELFQSDFIQLNTESPDSSYDYKVSINTVHNYVMNKDDSIVKMLKATSSGGLTPQAGLFNISVVVFDSGREFVVGNAQLPVEDLEAMVENYSSQVVNGVLPTQKQTLSRVLFIYGTTYSQRENCIIGKLQLEINYGIDKIFLTPEQIALLPTQPTGEGEEKNNAAAVLDEEENNGGIPSCFLHRETFIKRKIPLNAVLSVEIERINNLKESLENIEHFAKIQMSQASEKLSMKAGGASNISKNPAVIQTREQTDRRRILTQIFKSGLNLVVLASVFEEDAELKKRFPFAKHNTRMLFNTLSPIFHSGFEVGVQMDTGIFEYLKNKRAVFEVRHYLLGQSAQERSGAGGASISNNKSDMNSSSPSHRSTNTEENEERELMEMNDYIVLGYVRVPLLHLITKNNGIDGDFVIFDDYKQQMGSLKLRIALNHHSNKRPLYSETTKTLPRSHSDQAQSNTLIDRTVKLGHSLMRTSSASQNMFAPHQHQYLLGLNFVELVFKNRNQQQLFGTNAILNSVNNFDISQFKEQPTLMYLKFRLLGQSYQTKFVSQINNGSTSVFLRQLEINVIDIKKTVFVELDFLRQEDMEAAFSKPLEVQLWLKREHAQRYHQPETEVQLGSFFVELNDIGKIRNKRVKDQNGVLQAYEGYFSLYDYQREQVVTDRLGCKVLLIKKEYGSQLADLEVLFHNLNSIEAAICDNLDPGFQKGYAELDELTIEVQKSLQGQYQSLMRNYLSQLEYKNSDKVFYSPLFGPVPPFFRYAKRFDQFGVIEKFSKELQSIDNHGTGFVPVNLFRSILEHELKIKEKIVLDFINNLRELDQTQQLLSLDVNLFSHSLRSHVDYIVFLRKLAWYYECKQTFDKIGEDTLTKGAALGDNEHGEEVILKVDIESAIRLRNPNNELEPPNAFVILNIPYSGSMPQSLQTHIVHRSSYPTWHQVNQQIRFSLTNDVLRHLIDYPLEFEVYHQQAGLRDQNINTQIGVAYVDLSQMVYVDGIYTIEGFFHIVKKDRFKQGQCVTLTDPHRLSMESLGQLKLCISSNINLKRAVSANPLTRSIARENSPLRSVGHRTYQETPLQAYNVFEGRASGMSNFRSDNLHGSTHQLPPSQTQIKLEQSFNRAGQELVSVHDLKGTLEARMNELDELTRYMQQKHRSQSPDTQEQQQTRARPTAGAPGDPFTMTMGHGQSQEMRNSFQPFAYHPRVGGAMLPPRQQQYQQNAPSTIPEIELGGLALNEEDDFRRENVFENNISQGSSNFNQSAGDEGAFITQQQQEALALNQELLRQQEQLSAINQTSGALYGTFNQQQLLHHQTHEEVKVTPDANIFTATPGQALNQRLSMTENDEQQQPLQTALPSMLARQTGSQPQFRQHAVDDEEDIDEEEMRRLEKIMKSGNKK